MGYSCTTVAGAVLDFILDDLTKNVGNGTSNGWFNNARELFFEQGRENQDGAITGQVWRILNQSAYRIGSVRIEPNGTVTRFYGIPASLRKLAMRKLDYGDFGGLYSRPRTYVNCIRETMKEPEYIPQESDS